MSFINTSNSNDISSCLSEKNLFNKKINKIKTHLSFYSYSYKNYETKNIFNKLNSIKLKGKEKYKNFPIFEKREKEFEKNKKIKINLSLKKFRSFHKNENTSISNDNFIAENIIKGDYTKLPLLLEKLYNNSNKFKNKRKVINYNKKIIYEKKFSNKSNEENPNGNNSLRVIFLNKFKINITKKELNKIHMNKTATDILNKKNIVLDGYNNFGKLSFIDKLNKFTVCKKSYDSKNEQLLQLSENNANKIDKVKNSIKTYERHKKIFNDVFFTKYYKYYRNLFLEKDNQNNKDIILCKYIYSLKAEIKLLENKIKKLKKEKNLYVKWMLLQIQIKEKILNVPQRYIKILNEEYKKNKNTNEETDIILKYINNIIYENPKEIINQLKKYENQNIKLVEKLNEINYNIYSLKKELMEEYNDNINNIFMQELNNKNKIKEKLIEQNELLNKQMLLLNQKNNSYELRNNNNKEYPYNKIKHSKLYEKLKQLRKNIIEKEKGKFNYKKKKSEEDKMIEMLRDIEINIDIYLKKQKIYLEKYKNRVEEEKVKLEEFKKNERIKLHQKNLHDKFLKLKNKIIKKSNKIYFLPRRRISIGNNNLKKEYHSYFINNKRKEKDIVIDDINNI